MKHLVKIDELFKSTYSRAADKLSSEHPKRSKDIIDHATEKGETELKKPEIVRDWPYKFKFDVGDHTYAKRFSGEFTIISSNIKEGSAANYEGVDIHMISDWGVKVKLTMVWSIDATRGYFSSIMNHDYHTNVNKYSDYFNYKLDNRKDAIQIKKYLIEKFDSGELDFEKDPRELSINSFYTTK